MREGGAASHPLPSLGSARPLFLRSTAAPPCTQETHTARRQGPCGRTRPKPPRARLAQTLALPPPARARDASPPGPAHARAHHPTRWSRAVACARARAHALDGEPAEADAFCADALCGLPSDRALLHPPHCSGSHARPRACVASGSHICRHARAHPPCAACATSLRATTPHAIAAASLRRESMYYICPAQDDL